MEGYIPLVLLTFAVIINVECKQPNNVCKTFQDYKTKLNNSQCWYNPDVTANAVTTPFRNQINSYNEQIYLCSLSLSYRTAIR